MSVLSLESASSVRTVEEYRQWTRDCVRPVLGHESMVCGWGHIHAGGVGLDYIVAVDYPLEHLEAIRNRAGAIDTPILRRWLESRAPVMFETARPWPDIPVRWIESFRNSKLHNVVAHAELDLERCMGSYHSFYNLPSSPNQHHVDTLCSLVPVMHEVFCRVIETYRTEDRMASLTEREREVLRWVRLGKTNIEIATLASASESTVKHHLTRIFDKLGMANRTQLVRYLAEREQRQTPGLVTKLL